MKAKTIRQLSLDELLHRNLINRLRLRLIQHPQSVSDASLKAAGISRRSVLAARSVERLLRSTTISALSDCL
jgi:hypothetical protein